MIEVVFPRDLVNQGIYQYTIEKYEDELIELIDRSTMDDAVFRLEYNSHQVQTIEQSA